MKKTAIAALLGLAVLGTSPAAFAQELAVGGQIVGIQIHTEGVLVAGVGAVETAEGRRAPAAEAGVKEGDLVVAVNGTRRSARWAARRSGLTCCAGNNR